MNNIQLYPHQVRALEQTKDRNHVAYYLDMGLGKTFVGSEKAMQYPQKILIICQKSKIADWVEHFKTFYNLAVYDLTTFEGLVHFTQSAGQCVGVINYDLIFRRPVLEKLKDFTLLLDESSMIQNETAQRSKSILKLKPTNVILLSGTPTAGKYERLWSQLHLLGWDIRKKLYYDQYVVQEWTKCGAGFQVPKVVGYKQVPRLKKKLAEHGAVFMKSAEVFDLPPQVVVPVCHPAPASYRQFMRESVVTVDGRELIGDTLLAKRLYARMLCGYFNPARLTAFADLVESTEDRLVVFYNFNEELRAMREAIAETGRPVSIVNGSEKDLTAYEEAEDAITFVQYQAGAMGLNLQKANKVVYFSLTDRSELFEQSKKRTHRIGQTETCFYYVMTCPHTVETEIKNALEERKDYTDELFRAYTAREL